MREAPGPVHQHSRATGALASDPTRRSCLGPCSSQESVAERPQSSTQTDPFFLALGRPVPVWALFADGNTEAGLSIKCVQGQTPVSAGTKIRFGTTLHGESTLEVSVCTSPRVHAHPCTWTCKRTYDINVQATRGVTPQISAEAPEAHQLLWLPANPRLDAGIRGKLGGRGAWDPGALPTSLPGCGQLPPAQGPLWGLRAASPLPRGSGQHGWCWGVPQNAARCRVSQATDR